MGKRKGKQLQVDQAQIMELPVYVADVEQQNVLISKVDSLIEILREGKDASILINEIDNIVYRLYDLSSSEISTVNSFVEAQRRM